VRVLDSALMASPFSRESSLSVLVALVAVMVLTLAWLQYRWVGQVSEAERDRMQRNLRTAAAQFSIGFEQEVSRAAQTLQVDAMSIRDNQWAAYAERYDRWASQAADTRLVHDILVVDDDPRGSRQLRMRRWNPGAHAIETAAWPAELESLRGGITASLGPVPLRGGPDRRRRREPIALPHTDTYTLLRPSTEFLAPEAPGTAPRLSVLGATIIRLDPGVITTALLPGLAAQHFHIGDDGADYRVAIVEADPPHHVIWESAPGIAPTVRGNPDVTQPLLGRRPTIVVASTGNEPAGDDRGPGAPDPSPRMFLELVPGPPPSDAESPAFRPGVGGATESRWLLLATHQAGSLTAAVSAVRRRNLLLSSGILLLLTTAVGLIAVSARRAQRLARQQLEFVAAVSHEMRTPVSVIDTAARNLADGVVADPARVRRYGSTISTEARRLTETVERVLQLSGISAGSAAVPHAAVPVDMLVRESLAACQGELDARSVRVEVSVPDNLPDFYGDAPALRSCLQNLVSNAVKYGGDARWVGISATTTAGTPHKPMITLTVSDRGMGIAPEDRLHVLEPFYRGRQAIHRQIPGSGLGLHLVSRIVAAHHGHIELTSDPDSGTRVSVTIPVVPPQPPVVRSAAAVATSAPVVVSPEGQV
jgi:signal transduction histidine kinase